jgi:hypothetical protein
MRKLLALPLVLLVLCAGMVPRQSIIGPAPEGVRDHACRLEQEFTASYATAVRFGGGNPVDEDFQKALGKKFREARINLAMAYKAAIDEIAPRTCAGQLREFGVVPVLRDIARLLPDDIDSGEFVGGEFALDKVVGELRLRFTEARNQGDLQHMARVLEHGGKEAKGLFRYLLLDLGLEKRALDVINPEGYLEELFVEHLGIKGGEELVKIAASYLRGKEEMSSATGLKLRLVDTKEDIKT